MSSSIRVKLLYGLLVGLGTLIVAVAIIAVRLMVGPISLSTFVAPLERAANEQVEGYRVEVGNLLVAWSGWEEGADLQVTNLRVFEATGKPVATLERAAVGVDVGALLQGRLVANSIKFYGPALSLLRREDGSIGMRAERTGVGGTAVVFEQIAQALLDPQNTSGLAGLKSVRVIDAAIDIEDLALAGHWYLQNAELALQRSGQELAATFEGDFAAGDHVSPMALEATYDLAAQTGTGSLRFAQLLLSDLGRDFGPLRSLRGIDLPLDASLSIGVGQGFKLEQLVFEMSVGEGSLALEEVLSGVVSLDGATLEGKLDRVAGVLQINAFALRTEGGSLAGAANIAVEGAGQSIEINAELKKMPFTALAKLWPVTYKPFSRNWYAQNVNGGTIQEGTLRVYLGADHEAGAPLPDGSLRLEFAFDELQVSYLRPMPPIYNGSGRGLFTEERLELNVDQAKIRDDAAGLSVDIVGIHALLKNLNRTGTHYADISATIQSDVPQLVQLIDYQPLGYATRFNIDAATLQGEAALKARFYFPLLKRLRLDDLDINVEGPVSGFSAPIMSGRTSITNGQVYLRLDEKHLVAEGTAEVADLPLQARWTEQFVRGDGFGSEITMTGLMNAAQLLHSFGIDTVYQGDLAFDLTLLGNGLRLTDGEGSVDLAGTDFGIDLITLAKRAGAAMNAGFKIKILDSGFEVLDIDLQGDGVRASADASFDTDLNPRLIDIHSMQVGDNILAAKIFGLGENNWRVVATGPQIDLRPFIGIIFAEGGDESDLGLELDYAVAEGLAYDGVTVSDLAGMMRFERGDMGELHLAAESGDKASMALSYVSGEEGADLSLRSADAGLLIKALGLYDGGAGGELNLQARTDPTNVGTDTATMRGTVDIRNFKIVDAPGLAQVLSLTSIGGIRDLLTGGGLSFDRFRLAFTLTDEALTFKDAVAIGSSIGLRLDGRIYDNMSQAEITGSITPAYSLNTALRAVPVLGDVLSGGGQDGILSIGFTMSGPVEDLQVGINQATSGPGNIDADTNINAGAGQKDGKGDNAAIE